MTLNPGTLRNRTARLAFVFALLCAASTFASARTFCVNPTGTGCVKTISAGVHLANEGDIVEVATGVYSEQVTITKGISLIASANAAPIINATGKNNGIFINGMATAPNPGVANVLVSGFRVAGANFEGILIANASHVTLLNNWVTQNNVALAAGTCPGIPAFETSEAMDCGEGIHLMAADHATIAKNYVISNSGGILITDETGPSQYNLIRGNIVRDNGWACGITLASHPPATSIIPSATVSFGIWNNTISHNLSYDNGLLAPGAGAGVGIFAPGPGSTNTGNIVIGNDLHDNGLPGVTMHNHAFAPSPAPPVNFDNNVIIGNHIHGNAADTADAHTADTTGINIYSVAPINGTIISENDIANEAISIAIKAPSGQVDVHFNDFNGAGVGVLNNIGTGIVNATENWWHCPTGPTTEGCRLAVHPGIVFIPFLTTPYALDPDGD